MIEARGSFYDKEIFSRYYGVIPADPVAYGMRQYYSAEAYGC